MCQFYKTLQLKQLNKNNLNKMIKLNNAVDNYTCEQYQSILSCILTTVSLGDMKP